MRMPLVYANCGITRGKSLLLFSARIVLDVQFGTYILDDAFNL